MSTKGGESSNLRKFIFRLVLGSAGQEIPRHAQKTTHGAKGQGLCQISGTLTMFLASCSYLDNAPVALSMTL